MVLFCVCSTVFVWSVSGMCGGWSDYLFMLGAGCCAAVDSALANVALLAQIALVSLCFDRFSCCGVCLAWPVGCWFESGTARLAECDTLCFW